MEISQNSNQESNVTKLQNITRLVSRIKFNKIANITQKQKRISLAKIKMCYHGIRRNKIMQSSADQHYMA